MLKHTVVQESNDDSIPALAKSTEATDAPCPTKAFLFLQGLIILVQRMKFLLSFLPFSLKTEFKRKFTVCFQEHLVFIVGHSFVFSINKGLPLCAIIGRLPLRLANTFTQHHIQQSDIFLLVGSCIRTKSMCVLSKISLE